MKYMRITVNVCKMYTSDLMYDGIKVEKRLPTWQEMMLSTRGKAILIEIFLALSNYTMGVYLLPEEVYHKMDLARANFYGDSGQRKKYHMTK
jgi:hypothetical protein